MTTSHQKHLRSPKIISTHVVHRQASQKAEWLNTSFGVEDATFRIPHTVNTSFNNLLLDEDDLDFLGTGDYTITAPQVLSRASTPAVRSKNHKQTPSKFNLAQHETDAQVLEGDEHDARQEHQTTPTPECRSTAKRVSVTNTIHPTGAGSAAMRSSPYLQSDGHQPTDLTGTSAARRIPFSSPSPPTSPTKVAPAVSPYHSRTERITENGQLSEHGTTSGYRKPSDLVIASSQAPSSTNIGARLTAKFAAASSVSTATDASTSAIASSSSRPAVRPLTPERAACSTQDNQLGGGHGEAEQVDTFSLQSKTPRSSEHDLMVDAVCPRPSSLRKSSFLDKAPGLSATTETGGCEAEIEAGSPDLPDVVTGAAHAGSDMPLKGADEDLRASRGAASIPKIGKAAPTTEAKIVIRMKDKTVIDKGNKRKAETEPSRVKKAPRTVPLSSSALATKDTGKRTLKSDQTRELDSRPEKGEKLGGLPDTKKTRKSTEILQSGFPSDKTAGVKISSAFTSDISDKSPMQPHPPPRDATHDVGRVQLEASATHETLQGCDVPQHVEYSQEPQTTSTTTCRSSALPVIGGEALDARRVTAKPVFEGHGRTKIRDLDLRKLTKRPPRTSRVTPTTRSEAHSTKIHNAARATPPPTQHEDGEQVAHETSPTSSCLLTNAPKASDTRLALSLPPILAAQGDIRCAAIPSSFAEYDQNPSDFRTVEGSNGSASTESNALPHSTSEEWSKRGSSVALASSVPFARHTLIPDSTVNSAETELSLPGLRESAGSDLDMGEAASRPLETIAESSSPIAQRDSGVKKLATATSRPPQGPPTQSLISSDVKSKPMQRMNGREKTSKTNSSQKKPQPPADDMFERKKRDTYLRKGIDLTAHSTSRFQNTETRGKAALTRSGSQPIGYGFDKQKGSKQRPSAAARAVNGRTTSALGQSRPVPTHRSTDTSGTLTGELKQMNVIEPVPNQGDPPVSSLQLQSGARSTCARQDVAEDHSTKPSKGSSLKHVQKEGWDDPANASSNSLGTVIAERLFSFGHKVIDTLGLLSSQSEQRESRKEDQPRSSASSSQHSHTSPLRLSELSPRKASDRSNQPTAPSESDKHVWEEDIATPATNVHRVDVLIDTQTSRKRPSRGINATNVDSEYVEGTDTEERSPKRSRLAEANAGGMDAPGIDDLKEIRSRQFSGKASRNSARSGKPANSGPRITNRVKSTINNTGSKALQRQNSTAPKSKNKEDPKYFSSLTVPITTTFAGDLLRQRRAEARAERQGQENGKKSEHKDRLTKSADNVSCAGTLRLPLSDKQPDANVPSRPTIPQAFQFETDARLIHRRQDFEDKMKTWEKRAASSSSANSHSLTHKPIPDFRSVHAAQSTLIADMAARRREMIKPIVPVTPHFNIDQRLAEREKFEHARRAREEELERQLAAEQRMREEEEERAYQEARKRTVPRANPIPDWYAKAPKKSLQLEQVI